MVAATLLATASVPTGCGGSTVTASGGAGASAEPGGANHGGGRAGGGATAHGGATDSDEGGRASGGRSGASVAGTSAAGAPARIGDAGAGGEAEVGGASIAGGANFAGGGSTSVGEAGAESPSDHAATRQGVCLDDSWCWVTPLPAPNLYAVWSQGEHIWAVGRAGQALHWDGNVWRVLSSDTDADLGAVWGTTWDQVWAGGPDGVHYFDGAGWTHVLSGKAMHAIVGNSASDVWAAGDDGTWHWDGISWSLSDPNPARNISTSSSSNVWVLDPTNEVRRWDGTAWSAPLTVTTTANGSVLDAIWSDGPADVWVVGATHYGYELAIHWDGNDWTTVQKLLSDGGTLTSVWGNANELWSDSYGGSFVPLVLNGQIVGSGGVPLYPSSDRWVITQGSVLAHMHGGMLSPSPVPPPPTTYTADYPSQRLAIWGSGVDDVRIDTGQWDGTAWAYGFGTNFGGPIWGAAYDDVWIGQLGDPNGVVFHVHGDTTDTFQIPTASSIWGSSAHDVWILDFYGALSHWDGSAMSSSTLPWNGDAQPHMDQIWGTASDDVWGVGEQVFHWDGQTWSSVNAGTTARFHGIWGAASNDLWAATEAGLMHWNGSAWQSDSTVENAHLSGVFGFASNDIWAGGARDNGSGASGAGLLLHWDGSTWRVSLESPRVAPIAQIWGANTGDVWATVNRGVLRRH